jgi:hypothetical protein
MDTMQAFVETLKVSRKQSHRNLSVIPLLASDHGDPDYLTLEEGLSQGFVIITEISTGGSVPDLKLVNKSADKVLVVDGEELMGAKQNRILNASFLIAGNSEVVIPISCVEQGRWSYRSAMFSYGEKVMPPSLRRENLKNVAASLDLGAGYRSNQGEIWSDLAEKQKRMSVRSETGAMSDLFEDQKGKLDDYLKAFHLMDNQVGALFAINGAIVGMESFGHWQTFSKFFKKLIQSYALDALDWLEEGKEEKEVPAADIRRFLEGVQKAPQKTYPSLGLGENIRFQVPFVSGAALIYNGTVFHLSAFGHDDKGTAEVKVPFQRFSQRRKKLNKFWRFNKFLLLV